MSTTILGNYASHGGPTDNTDVNNLAHALDNYSKTAIKIAALNRGSKKATSDDYKKLNQSGLTVLRDWTALSCSDMKTVGKTMLGTADKAVGYTSTVNFINDSSNDVGGAIAKLILSTPEQINCMISGFNSQNSDLKQPVPQLDVDKFSDSIFRHFSTSHRVAETCLGRVLIISLVIVGLLCLLFLGLFISASKKLKGGHMKSTPRRNTYYDDSQVAPFP